MDLKLDCALDLTRRLPPQTVERNLSDIIDLVPSLCDDLLSSVDQPLKVSIDVMGKKYLICDYNRDGDSYRSPWTNLYNPPLEVGPDGEGCILPSNRLRILEVQMNAAFDKYRESYYEGGISSCYLWNSNTLKNDCFAGVILFKKIGDESNSVTGCWDSIHVVEVQERRQEHSAYYKLTSTCMLWLHTNVKEAGTINLGGSITRHVEHEALLSGIDQEGHIVNIGQMVEDKENQMRNELYEIYFGKTRDIVNCLRSSQTMTDKAKQNNLANTMFDEMQEQRRHVQNT